MSKHTKGPWAVHEWSSGWSIYGGRSPLFAGIEVARIAAEDDERERQNADARLIATAPDLLEACEALTATAREGTDGYNAAYRSALAAIKKARGE
jgi:hypothetical protein